MNGWLVRTLALGVLCPLAHAHAGGEGWSGLDEELEALAGVRQGGGVDIGALLRADYRDVDSDLDSFDEIGGFELTDADVWLEGQVGDLDWRVSVQFGGEDEGGTDLRDAYAAWGLSDHFGITFGRFRAPATHTGRLDPEEGLLFERTRIGQLFDSFDEGVIADYELGDLRAFFAIQNGETGLENRHSYLVRAEWGLFYEDGGFRDVHWDADVARRRTTDGTVIGAFHWEDDMMSEAVIQGLDVASHYGPWDVEAEVAAIDEDFPGFAGPFDPDTTPWSVTGQVAIQDDLDVALRYQDFDDDDDSNAITIGLDWYPGSPAARWSFEIDSLDSDDDALDGEVLRAGLALGSNRPTPASR